MHPCQQGVGGAGEQAAGLHLAAIGPHPAIPQSPQPKGRLVAPAKQPGLLPRPAGVGVRAGLPLVEAIGGHKGAAMAPGTAEGGLFGHGFGAGIDRAPSAQGLLAPFRQQAPQHQTHLQASMLLPLQQEGFAGAHLRSGQVVLHQAGRERTLQALQELIDWCGEGVAAAHGGGGVRFSCPQERTGGSGVA